MRSFLFLLLSAGFAFAQTTSDPQAIFKKVDDKLTQKTAKFYLDSADPDGTLVQTRIESYKDGDLVSIEVNDDISYYQHDYDEKGRPKERRQLNSGHMLYGKFVYTYAGDGTCKVRTAKHGTDGKELPGTSIEYSYDANDRWLSAEEVQVSGLIRRCDNEYDAAGKLSKSIFSETVNGHKEVDETTTYSYDAKGWLKEVKTDSASGTPVEKVTLNALGDVMEVLNYDGLGNMAQRVEVTPSYNPGDKLVGQVWKIYSGDAKIPNVTGRTVFEYEYSK